ncbi:MAG: GMC family oxidoreductase [Myxococcales bacterium]|nr:GMC family oxidoreductase [Myxococcales bacterium]
MNELVSVGSRAKRRLKKSDGGSNPITQGRFLEDDVELGCDVVIVGSGASGAAVACELAEAGQDVIVVEEGGYFRPEQYGAMRPSETLRHLFRDGGLTFVVGLDESPMVNMTMGRCVGGSSVLTGGVCFRIPGFILKNWRDQQGLHMFSEEELEPAYQAVEAATHIERVPLEMRSESTNVFARGAERMGYELKPMHRNTKDCNGCGRCNFGCPHGAKMSVDIAYIPRALAAGARVFSDFRVDSLITKGARAAGVEGRIYNAPGLRRPGGAFRIHAKRVVMAAGAYNTPGLLKRFGVGKQSGQVGRNMTVHPGFRMMARFDRKLEGWKGALQSAFADAYEDQRITLTALYVPPGVLAATMKGIGREHIAKAEGIPNLSIFGGMIHDDPGGRLHHLLGKAFSTYRMSARDRDAMYTITRVMAETYFAAGAREVYLPVLGMAPVSSMDDLRKIDFRRIPAKRYECSSQHPLGTTRMGVTPEHSVVDPDGRAWELDELYVVDGGIVPSSLGVNPQQAIMTLATRIAWKLRERPLPSW